MLSQERIFLKICETLKEKGFEHFTLDTNTWWKNSDNRKDALDINAHYCLIFSNEFAKFVWGEENIKIGDREGFAWKFHLSQMSQSDDKLGYIAENYLSKLV